MARLDVIGGPTTAFFRKSTGNDGFSLVFNSHLDGRNWWFRDDSGVDRFRFSRGSTDAVVWDVLKISGSDATGDQIWYANNAERLRLSAAGNVGVGTPNPTAKLHIEGVAEHTNGNVLVSGNNAPTLFLKNNSGELITQIMSWDGAGMDAMAGARIGTRSRTAKAGHVHFTTDDNIRMTIRDSGDIGIGTISPSNIQGWSRVLDVNGQYSSKLLVTENSANVKTGVFSHGSWLSGGVGKLGTESSHPVVLMAGYGNDVMTLTTNGSVGLGTTTPQAALHIARHTSGEVARFQGRADSSNNRNYISLYTTNPGFWWELSNQDGSGFGASNGLAFRERSVSDPSIARLFLQAGGNVGVGLTDPNYKLDVAGTVRAHEVIVQTSGADHVFADDYRVTPLAEVEQHIKEHKHLPGIPSAKEMSTQGVGISELQTKLLAKVEELTLHLIAHEKSIESLRKENADLRNQVGALQDE